jgi:hypothetical protein
MPIIPLSVKQYEREIKPLKDRIVRAQKIDGYYEFFVSELLPCRRLLAMTDYWLAEEGVSALEIMVNQTSPEGFYVERSGITYTSIDGFQASLRSNHFDISSDQFRYVIHESGILKDFTYGKLIDEHTLEGWTFYSKQGDWVIYIDSANFLILAGNPEIIEIFDRNFTLDYMAQVRAFLANELANWETPFSFSLDPEDPVNWLPRLMIHLFGHQQSLELLQEFNVTKDE